MSHSVSVLNYILYVAVATIVFASLSFAQTNRVVVTFDTVESAVEYNGRLSKCGTVIRQYSRRVILDVHHPIVNVETEKGCITSAVNVPDVVVKVELDLVLRI
jgi:hypothetical protein